ncbi:MAG: hypothetical protein ABIQ43_08235 [Sphingomonas sp.]
MKKLILMAALAVGVAVLPTAASADPGQTTVTRTTVSKTTDNERRYDGGRRSHWKTVCKTKWRHGRKWRQCHKVCVRW